GSAGSRRFSAEHSAADRQAGAAMPGKGSRPAIPIRTRSGVQPGDAVDLLHRWNIVQRSASDGGNRGAGGRTDTDRAHDARHCRGAAGRAVYSAAWDRQPTEIYVANRQTPEARSLGIKDAELLSISKSTELAVLLHRDRSSRGGTLARVPLAGGSPREIADDVVEADWSPDGANLAIIRGMAGKYRIEYPLGSVLYDTPHALRDIRVSPDGNRLAFIEPHGEKYDVAILEKNARSPVTIARGWDHGVTGLAWRADQKEIWITGTDTGEPPALCAIDPA